MNKSFVYKLVTLAAIVFLACLCGRFIGFNARQILAIATFTASILGAFFFWNFRLSFAFFGCSILLFTRIMTIEQFIQYSSLDIIFFLIGMMIFAGFLKEVGFFAWILSRTIIMKNLTATKFMVMLTLTSALLACLIDEVSSIVFMVMLIFELSDYFEVKPVPFIIASVFATNIGSAGTVIGNPIGILIATKASFTFEDFLVHAFPLMLLNLFILLGILLVVFRKDIRQLNEKMKLYGANEYLVKLLRVPPEKKLRIGLVFFIITILLIALHHRIELLFGLKTDTMLLITPLLMASIVMMWRRESARRYVEKDVEWWTLLFFIFLFAQAGMLTHLGVAQTMAEKMLTLFSNNFTAILSTVLFGGAFISSLLDNVVVVTAFIPIIKSINLLTSMDGTLWWALLFGACFGGNITIIGSTANIIAIGKLEKDRNESINFLSWFKVGILVGIVTLTCAFLFFLFAPHF